MTYLVTYCCLVFAEVNLTGHAGACIYPDPNLARGDDVDSQRLHTFER